jgi:hypothetical protein
VCVCVCFDGMSQTHRIILSFTPNKKKNRMSSPKKKTVSFVCCSSAVPTWRGG